MALCWLEPCFSLLELWYLFEILCGIDLRFDIYSRFDLRDDAKLPVFENCPKNQTASFDFKY